jgi:hypothetical protein
MSHVGPVATDSLERRGALTSVSAREPLPQPDANYADQNWDPGGHRIFRTDLDSHTNMPVVGAGNHVLVYHNRICEVSPYSTDCEPMEVPLVDAAVR